MNFTVKEEESGKSIVSIGPFPKHVKGVAHGTANHTLLLPSSVIYNSISKSLTKPNMHTIQGRHQKIFNGYGPYIPILNDIIMLCNLFYRVNVTVESGESANTDLST